MIKSLTLILGILLSSISLANDLNSIFAQSFFTKYQAGKCGQNILGLVETAEEQGTNLYRTNILEMSNTGGSVFGMVNAEFARDSGLRNPSFPANGPRQLPGQKNWFHHIILEHGGMIYDFDFGNTPQILPISDYFEQMFLNDDPAQGNMNYAGRDEKLTKYQVIIRPALDTVRAKRDRLKTPEGQTLSLRDYLELRKQQ